jgi:hypothetical protein
MGQPYDRKFLFLMEREVERERGAVVGVSYLQ